MAGTVWSLLGKGNGYTLQSPGQQCQARQQLTLTFTPTFSLRDSATHQLISKQQFSSKSLSHIRGNYFPHCLDLDFLQECVAQQSPWWRTLEKYWRRILLQIFQTPGWESTVSANTQWETQINNFDLIWTATVKTKQTKKKVTFFYTSI